jgi:RNA polymerase sigma-70 factor (ECF subfamily)
VTAGAGAAGGGDAEDRALLAAHLAGDVAAFGTLVTRHRDRLWAVALRTTGDREEAADALQDALIAAFRRADSYRGDAAVTTWLHRIVVNAALDRLRRRKALRLVDRPPDDHDGVGAQEAARDSATTGDPVEAAEQADRRHKVLLALARLPEDQRCALVLVDMEGYSVEETAELLGVPPGTVKSRCSRGRARLRGVLEEMHLTPHQQPGGNPTEVRRVASPGQGTTRRGRGEP